MRELRIFLIAREKSRFYPALFVLRSLIDQRPGTRQQVRDERRVAAEAELFCAEQVPPEKNTKGICQVDDWQLVAVWV